MLHYLYLLYVILIALPLFLVATIVTAVAVIIASMCGDPDRTGYVMPRLWSRLTCALFWVRVQVDGREHIDKRQSYVFLANHQGYFDIFLVYGYLGHNFKWMMKEYLRRIPFVGYACAKSHHIYVGDTLASIQQTVTQAQQTLRHGMSMVIFPEGTRTKTGRMAPFKKGAFTLAGEIGLPIVPLTVNGSFHIFNRNSPDVHPGRLRLTIHQPLTAEARRGRPTRVVMSEVWQTINDGLDEEFRKTEA